MMKSMLHPSGYGQRVLITVGLIVAALFLPTTVMAVDNPGPPIAFDFSNGDNVCEEFSKRDTTCTKQINPPVGRQVKVTVNKAFRSTCREFQIANKQLKAKVVITHGDFVRTETLGKDQSIQFWITKPITYKIEATVESDSQCTKIKFTISYTAGT
jgi:hypothetical protein